MNKIILFFSILILISFVYGAPVEVTKQGFTDDFSKSEIVDLDVAESSSIRIGNPREDSLEIHKFRVVDIRNTSVNITVDKTRSLIVNVAQTRRVDVDEDDVFDISVTLNNIRTGVATLTFKEINIEIDLVNKNPVQNNSLNNTEIPMENIIEKPLEMTEKELDINLEADNKDKFRSIFGIIGGIFILFLIVIFIIHRNR